MEKVKLVEIQGCQEQPYFWHANCQIYLLNQTLPLSNRHISQWCTQEFWKKKLSRYTSSNSRLQEIRNTPCIFMIALALLARFCQHHPTYAQTKFLLVFSPSSLCFALFWFSHVINVVQPLLYIPCYIFWIFFCKLIPKVLPILERGKGSYHPSYAGIKWRVICCSRKSDWEHWLSDVLLEVSTHELMSRYMRVNF